MFLILFTYKSNFWFIEPKKKREKGGRNMLDSREFKEELDTCNDVEKVTQTPQLVKDLGEMTTNLGRWGVKKIVNELKREMREGERSY